MNTAKQSKWCYSKPESRANNQRHRADGNKRWNTNIMKTKMIKMLSKLNLKIPYEHDHLPEREIKHIQ